jgi:hypothetical protein
MTVPLGIQREIAGLCRWCDSPRLEGLKLCQTHLDAKRASNRRWRAALRKERRKNRRCFDCGGKSKSVRCSRCQRKRKKPRVVEKTVGVVDQWRVDPGTTWLRFRGKGRRGRLTRAEQAEEYKRDADFAIEGLREFKRRLDVWVSEDVQTLGPVQREEVKRRTGEPLGVAGRFVDELHDRFR